ncbi:glycosyltransferase [Methanosalsum natronophilum]|uniref:glycosyltransferase n=1 Tax=Methanosalsum natronophilum TaxID=768733 RepID=UPI0021699772|nr:glycosyltransferase [Methanosalsum natronophilum]MCS3924889.1 glycosyltransferase involved in cell wall biosynthesis [Methanosalsum natronophilum]
MKINKIKSGFSSISVIVPVYNDPKGITDTLDSLVAQDYPGDFEIIVADNGSNDDTISIVMNYQVKYPRLIKLVVEEEIQSSYAARNKGIGIANGSLIAFIDADMWVGPSWLTEIHDSIKNNNTDYLACNVELVSESDCIFASYDIISGFPIKEYLEKRHFAPTCCLVVKSSLFSIVGRFDQKLISSGDYEFGNRVYNAGYMMRFDPNIIMKHPARNSFQQIIKKSFRIGRGLYQLSLYHPELNKSFKNSLVNSINVSKVSENNWAFFTFKKNGVIWNDLPFHYKILFYYIDIISKIVKLIGLAYENAINIKLFDINK